jgi:hypothetical protein
MFPFSLIDPALWFWFVFPQGLMILSIISSIYWTFVYICRSVYLNSLLILKTALLRYKSHSMHFSHLKCTIHWLLVWSQNCATIINFRSFLSPQQETLYSLAVTSLSHLLP